MDRYADLHCFAVYDLLAICEGLQRFISEVNKFHRQGAFGGKVPVVFVLHELSARKWLSALGLVSTAAVLAQVSFSWVC